MSLLLLPLQEGLGPKGDNLFTEEEMEIIKAVPYVQHVQYVQYTYSTYSMYVCTYVQLYVVLGTLYLVPST